MEVATQTVLNFDLNSGKRRPFSSYFGSQLRSPDSPKNDAFQHPAEIKCYDSELSASAAMNVQKFYRGYRTRRLLADSAVVVEELWWQAINFARLSHSTISFFNFLKPETAAARWIRISLNASKVGKGLSKDAKAQKLAFQHWIEAIDPRHRYGHGLHIYYEKWCKADTGQPFFYWLDVGDGKEVDLPKCPRLKLRQQCIKYLGPQEREHYEYAVVEGKIVQKQTEMFLDTNNRFPGAKWIFVMSTSKRLYAGEKKKGVFHHSSFLAGGATLAAGRLVVENGTLTVLHFCLSRHTVDITALLKKDLTAFYHFLKLLESTLTKSKISCDQIHKANEDYENYEYDNSYIDGSAAEVLNNLDSCQPDIPDIKEDKNLLHEKTEESQTETKDNYRTSLSGVLQCPKSEVPKTAILQRIKSKRAAKSYELGHQLSLKWSTGAGPRIGCIADYPPELRLQALEFTNVCPKTISL